jgi:hypothetical protein
MAFTVTGTRLQVVVTKLKDMGSLPSLSKGHPILQGQHSQGPESSFQANQSK